MAYNNGGDIGPPLRVEATGFEPAHAPNSLRLKLYQHRCGEPQWIDDDERHLGECGWCNGSTGVEDWTPLFREVAK
jgi:hypothetical protein